MKICILSDSHDNRYLLAQAVAAARQWGAQAVLHCGDVVAPTTLRALQKFGLPVHVIYGNNAGDVYNLSRLAHEPGSVVRFHGQDADIELGGKRIFLVHYPHYARAMALTGDYDLVCCGHEHRARIDWVTNIKGGKTLWIDPGTVGGVGAAPTYIVGDLATMEFSLREVQVEEAAKHNVVSVSAHN